MVRFLGPPSFSRADMKCRWFNSMPRYRRGSTKKEVKIKRQKAKVKRMRLEARDWPPKLQVSSPKPQDIDLELWTFANLEPEAWNLELLTMTSFLPPDGWMLF